MLKFRRVSKKTKTDLQKLEDKLWEVFSVFIRLRDSDVQGIGKCFTCRRVVHWSKGDAGHGIPRQHKATKFNECNNHLQCKHCNGFEGGMREVYRDEMNKRYGFQTWEKMLVASKQPIKWSVVLLQNNIDYYTDKVKELKDQKGMI
jgi:hypothetical protein